MFYTAHLKGKSALDVLVNVLQFTAEVGSLLQNVTALHVSASAMSSER
jgi:hypothetical protein